MSEDSMSDKDDPTTTANLRQAIEEIWPGRSEEAADEMIVGAVEIYRNLMSPEDLKTAAGRAARLVEQGVPFEKVWGYATSILVGLLELQEDCGDAS